MTEARAASARGFSGKVTIQAGHALLFRVLSIGLAFPLGAILARQLSRSELGVYYLIISASAFLSLSIQLGLQNVVVQRIGAALLTTGRSEGRQIAYYSIRRIALSGLGLVMVGACCAFGFSDRWVGIMPLGQTVLFLSLLAASSAILTLLAEINRGFYRIKTASSIGGLLPCLLSIIGALLLVTMKVRLAIGSALIICVGANALSVVVGLVLTRNLLERNTAAIGSGLLRDACPFWIMGILWFVFQQVGLWMTGAVLGAEAAAMYGSATRLALLLSVPVEAFEAVLPPLIAGLYAAGDMDKLEQVMQRSARIQAVLVFLGTTLFLCFGGTILTLVFGGPFRGAYPILAVLSLGWFVRSLFGACGFALSMTGHATILLRITWVGSLLSLGGQYLLGRFGGGLAVAFGSAIGLVGFNLAVVWVGRGRLGINVTAMGRAQ